MANKDPEKRKAYQKAYYASHRAENSAASKAYYAVHAVKLRARSRARSPAWRASNEQRIKAYRKLEHAKLADSERKKELYAENPEPVKAKAKAWRLANKARWAANHKAWVKINARRVAEMKLEWERADRRAHPEKHRDKAHQRRARTIGTQAEPVDLKQILRDSKGLCGICGKPLDLFGIDFDHIIPLSRGGTHTRENIQASHARCNRAKGAKVG